MSRWLLTPCRHSPGCGRPNSRKYGEHSPFSNHHDGWEWEGRGGGGQVHCMTVWMENSFYQLNKQTEPIIPSTPVLSHIFRTGRRWDCGRIAVGDENHFAGVCIIWVCRGTRWFSSLPPAHNQKLMWSETQPKAISIPVLVSARDLLSTIFLLLWLICLQFSQNLFVN